MSKKLHTSYLPNSSWIIEAATVTLLTALFVIGGLFVSKAQAQTDVELGVTQISSIQTFATADGTFADGWKWVFNVTVPEGQTILKMKFADWTGLLGTIPAAGNIRFYSAQSTNASTSDSAILITASSTYSDEMYLDPNADLDVQQAGQQIQIVIEALVPPGSAGGSYSTSYGIDTAAPQSQSIGFDNPGDKTYGDPDFTIDASSTSGLPVTLVTTGPIVLNGETVHITGTGPVTITASQLGDGDYTPAAPVSQSFNVIKATPTVTWPTPADITYGTALGDTQLDATSTFQSNPLPGEYAYTPPSGAVLDAGANQTLSVVFTPTDSADFNGVSSSTLINVDMSGQTINFDNPGDKTYGDPDFTIDASSTSGLPVTMIASGDCSIVTGETVHITAAGSCALTASQAGDTDYDAATDVTQTFTIDQAPLKITADDVSKTYLTANPAFTATFTGFVNGETSTNLATPVVFTTTAGLNSPVGMYDIVPSGATDPNYDISFATGTLTVTKAIAEVNLDDLDQSYDGAPIQISTSTVPAGLGVDVTYNGFATPPTNAGSYAVIGTIDDPNYSGTADATLVVAKAPITVTAQPNTKVYDGTRAVSTTTPKLTSGTLFGTDTLAFSEAYDTKDVGTGKILTPVGIVSDGNDGNNYAVTQVNDMTGIIRAMPITVTAVTGTKIYDGTVTSPLTPTVAPALAPGDAANFIETYNSKDVDLANTLTPSGTVNDGNSGNDYAYTFDSVAGNITTKALDVTVTINNKVYDASTTATMVGTFGLDDLSGIIPADQNLLTVSGQPTFAFDNKNAGLDKPVSLVYTDDSPVLESPDPQELTAGDYNLTWPLMFADITPEPITVTAVANTKTYDGSTSAAAMPTVTLGTVYPSDTPSFVETYDTPIVGTGKTLTPSGTVNDGNSGNDYAYTFVPVETGVIDQATPTFTYNLIGSVAAGTDISAVISEEDAQSTIPGQFTYDPQSGTVSSSTPLTLQITFTPSDVVDYGTVTKTTTISVSN